MKPRKPRVLWAFFDCNGHFVSALPSRYEVLLDAYAITSHVGGEAVKFVEAKPRKRKAGRKTK